MHQATLGYSEIAQDAIRYTYYKGTDLNTLQHVRQWDTLERVPVKNPISIGHSTIALSPLAAGLGENTGPLR